MNSFSNAIMQRHLGQAETVSPRPVGLYEPVRNTGIENPNHIEQNLTDTGQDVTPFAFHEANRFMQTPEVQTHYPLSAEKWPGQEQEHPQSESRQAERKALQITPPLLTSEFQPLVQSIPAPAPSANTQRSTGNDWNGHDIQQPKTEQIKQRHLIHTQIERQIETHVEPIMKSDNAVGVVQPAPTAIHLGSQKQSNQSERFTPPPKMDQLHAAPVVKVSIGRIEVKAVVQTPAQPAKSSSPSKPRMSLDEYLKKQDNHTK